MVGCSARERDGLHVPCRLESRWGTPERGQGGQKLPGDLASSVQSPESGRQRQRKWEDCTWCILKLGPTLPQEGKPGAGATEPGRRDGERGEGPGVSAASSAALLAPLPGSQGGGCRPHARDPPPAAALAVAGLMAEGGAPAAFVEGEGPDHRSWFQWSGSSLVRSAEVCETAEVWHCV